MNVSRPLRILRYGVDASRPSMRLKVALGLTTHLTSKGVVASGLSCNVNTLLLLRMADRGIAVIVGGVDIAILGVRHSDNTILDVDIAILGVDIPWCRHSDPRFRCRHSDPESSEEETQEKWGGLRGVGRGVVSCVIHLEASWSVRESVNTRTHKWRGVPCYMPISVIRPGRGLNCR